MTTPFIRLFCYGKSGKKIYTNYHAFVLIKQTLETEADRKFEKFKTESSPVETMNVVAVGLDSMSRLNFMRQMPKVRRYILQNLRGVELKGMNKVADSTFVNLVPILTGKFVAELPYDRKHPPKAFDNYTFLWNYFSDRGYRTLFAEDAPWMATFNMGKGGFHKEPVDYYLRPFCLALQPAPIWHHDRACVGTKLETEIVLDYLKEFMTRFEKKPHFAVTFISKFTHGDVNAGGMFEDVYFDFFRWMNRTGYLNNTVVIFFSDHGTRYGPIRETYMGKLEERLPQGYVIMPPWFPNKYPLLWKNLKANGDKLTTPFDHHETMKDLLMFDGREKRGSVNNRGISLFSHIPVERTCEHAGIISHWCTCHQRQAISSNDTAVKNATDAAVSYINSKLDRNIAPCAALTVKKITDALKFQTSDHVLKFVRSKKDRGQMPDPLVDYLITFQTTPGNGVFEATVRHDAVNERFEVVGDISRINKYGNAGDCMPIHSLEKFCHCM